MARRKYIAKSQTQNSLFPPPLLGELNSRLFPPATAGTSDCQTLCFGQAWCKVGGVGSLLVPTGEPETIMLVPTGGLEHTLLVDLEGRWISWEFLWNGGDCHETVAACVQNLASVTCHKCSAST